jgi:MFS family permease
MFVPVGNAFVTELFPSKKAERISLFSSSTIVGRAIAPFLGGYILLVTNYGFHQLYGAVGIAGVTAFITALLLLKERPHPIEANAQTVGEKSSRLLEGWLAVAKSRGTLVVSLVEAAQYYAYGATEFFLVGYLKEVAHFDSFTIGIISGSQLAVVPLLKPLMGKLSDKAGRTIPIVTGSLISAFALGVIPFTTSFPFLLLISTVYGFGFSMVTSSTPALVSELTDKALVGTGMGFLSTIMDVGQTLGPIITGLILATTLAYEGTFLSLTAILVVTCIVFLAARVGGVTRYAPAGSTPH